MVDKTKSFKLFKSNNQLQVIKSEPIPKKSVKIKQKKLYFYIQGEDGGGELLSNPHEVEIQYKCLKGLFGCEMKIVKLFIKFFDHELGIYNVQEIQDLRKKIIDSLYLYEQNLIYHNTILKRLFDFEIVSLLIRPLVELIQYVLRLDYNIVQDQKIKQKIISIKEASFKLFNNLVHFYYQIGVSVILLYNFEYKTGFFLHFFELIYPMFKELENKGLSIDNLDPYIDFTILDSIKEVSQKLSLINIETINNQSSKFLLKRQNLVEALKNSQMEQSKQELLKLLQFWPCQIQKVSSDEESNQNQKE